MHRRILLGIPLSLIILLAHMLTPAHAQAATCTTHQLNITSWSIQSDTLAGNWDFQCGGATNTPWQIVYQAQYRTTSGTWKTPTCSNGDPCSGFRPSGTFFNGGTEHTDTFNFAPAIQIDCRPWRIKGVAHFNDGSLSPAFYSLTYQIGGC